MASVTINPSDDALLANPYSNDFLWIDEDVDGVLAELHHRYSKRAVAVFGGRTRNVFVMRNGYVVKIPKNFDGLVDNDWEGSVSNTHESLNHPWHVQYPKTRLSYQGDVPVLFMELITPMVGAAIIERFGVEPITNGLL